jgi:CBS-domain-containing membrane protein
MKDPRRTYADAMVDHAATLSKAEANKVLLRVGFSEEKIVDLFSELEDPIDVDRDAAVLEKHGISRDILEDLMGGSP